MDRRGGGEEERSVRVISGQEKRAGGVRVVDRLTGGCLSNIA